MRVKIVLIAIFLITAASAQAEMVQYVDDQGKIHYVNTVYSKVPEKYKNQLTAQPTSSSKQEQQASSVIQPGVKNDMKPEEKERLFTEKVKAMNLENNVLTQWAQKMQENQAKGNYGLQTQLTKEQSVPVDLFVKSNCPSCQFLEAALKGRGIIYTRFDIEHSTLGYDQFVQLGGKDVPFARVGNQTVNGADAGGIIAAINAQ